MPTMTLGSAAGATPSLKSSDGTEDLLELESSGVELILPSKVECWLDIVEVIQILGANKAGE
jgi:hypothetical protein